MTEELKLLSAFGGNSVYYHLPLSITNDRDEASEIVETIRWVCEEIPDLKKCLAVNCLDLMKNYNSDNDNIDQVFRLVEQYNKSLECYAQTKVKDNFKKRISSRLLKHVLEVCYNKAVIDPDKLNQYEPFSPEVYGETSFELVEELIKVINFKEYDHFIDLGSGVGQVVLHIAAATKSKFSYGIEKADCPAKYSQDMALEFKKWMNFFGKPYSEFELVKGDFLNLDKIEAINAATVIFVNNFAFGPQVDHQLKLKFANIKEGTRIVSSRSFCPLTFHITDRNLSDIGTIMKVEELSAIPAAVSWTDKPFAYFLHTIDRSLLEKYFKKMKSEGGVRRLSHERIDKLRRRFARHFNNSDDTEPENIDLVPVSVGRQRNRKLDVHFSSSSNSTKNSICNSQDHSETNSPLPTKINPRRSKKRSCVTRSVSLTPRRAKRLKRSTSLNTSNNFKKGGKKNGRIRRVKARISISGMQALDIFHNESKKLTIDENFNSENYNDRRMSTHFIKNEIIYSLASLPLNASLQGPIKCENSLAPSQFLRGSDLLSPLLTNMNAVQKQDMLNSLGKLVGSFEASMLMFLHHMSTSTFKSKLNSQIAAEKAKNDKYLEKIRILTAEIAKLKSEGTVLLKKKLTQMEISSNDPREIFSELQLASNLNNELTKKVSRLKAELNHLEFDHTHLLNFHKSIKGQESNLPSFREFAQSKLPNDYNNSSLQAPFTIMHKTQENNLRVSSRSPRMPRQKRPRGVDSTGARFSFQFPNQMRCSLPVDNTDSRGMYYDARGVQCKTRESIHGGKEIKLKDEIKKSRNLKISGTEIMEEKIKEALVHNNVDGIIELMVAERESGALGGAMAGEFLRMPKLRPNLPSPTMQQPLLVYNEKAPVLKPMIREANPQVMSKFGPRMNQNIQSLENTERNKQYIHALSLNKNKQPLNFKEQNSERTNVYCSRQLQADQLPKTQRTVNKQQTVNQIFEQINKERAAFKMQSEMNKNVQDNSQLLRYGIGDATEDLQHESVDYLKHRVDRNSRLKNYADLKVFKQKFFDEQNDRKFIFADDRIGCHGNNRLQVDHVDGIANKLHGDNLIKKKKVPTATLR